MRIFLIQFVHKTKTSKPGLHESQLKKYSMEELGGNCNFKTNINAQHEVRKRAITSSNPVLSSVSSHLDSTGHTAALDNIKFFPQALLLKNVSFGRAFSLPDSNPRTR